MTNRALPDTTRLDRSLRTRLWVSFAASAVAFAAMATVATSVVDDLAETFHAQSVTIRTIEELRGDLRTTASLALRGATAQPGTGKDRLLALAEQSLEDVRADLARLRATPGPSGVVVPADGSMADTDLQAVEQEFLMLLDSLGTARDAGLVTMIGQRIQQAVDIKFPERLRGVIERSASASEAIVVRSERIALILGGSVMIVLLIQVPLTYLPLSRAMIRRSEELLEANEAIHRATMQDRVTGLPTRAALVIQASELLADRAAATAVCFAMIDIDRFREINDTLGRQMGDKYLAHLAETLRKVAGESGFAARVGADDFVVLRTGAGTAEEMDAFADEIHAAVSQPVFIEGERLSMSCFVGLTCADRGEDLDNILTDGDIALDDARRAGPGSRTLFTPALRKKMHDRRQIIEGLREALENDRIEPFFQPQIAGGDGAISGFEALVRWRHPERGVLTPWHFLDAAEGAGMLGDIAQLMIKKSLKTMSDWHSAGFMVPQIGLNFTASDLRGTGFIDMLKFDVDRFGLEPRNVCIELLETAMIEDERDPIIKTLADLTAAGFPVELDDFGTGHSSLSNLARIKVDGMKIDRSFVTRMDESEHQQKLTQSMLGLAESLDIDSLAEGVETEAERDLLVAMGCKKLQGYGIAKPMSAEDSTAWMTKYIAELPGRQFVGIDLATSEADRASA